MDGFQTTYEQLLKAEIVKAEMEMSQALGAAGGIKGESIPSAKGSQLLMFPETDLSSLLFCVSK